MRAVWSRNLPLTNAGALLNLVDGAVGCDHVTWRRFRQLRRFLLCHPRDFGRFFSGLLQVVSGAPGHLLLGVAFTLDTLDGQCLRRSQLCVVGAWVRF